MGRKRHRAAAGVRQVAPSRLRRGPGVRREEGRAGGARQHEGTVLPSCATPRSRPLFRRCLHRALGRPDAAASSEIKPCTERHCFRPATSSSRCLAGCLMPTGRFTCASRSAAPLAPSRRSLGLFCGRFHGDVDGAVCGNSGVEEGAVEEWGHSREVPVGMGLRRGGAVGRGCREDGSDARPRGVHHGREPAVRGEAGHGQGGEPQGRVPPDADGAPGDAERAADVTFKAERCAG